MHPTPTASPLETTWPNAMEPQREVDDRPALAARAFGRTDRGKTRRSNEDQFLIACPHSTRWVQQSSLEAHDLPRAGVEGELFVVADGMGGHAGGAQASALAVSAVETSLLSALRWAFSVGGPEAAGVDVLDQLSAALRSADARVCEEAARTPALWDMGTTLTMAYRHGSWLFVAHAGDSRSYILRNGALHRVTQDHTIVGEMVRRGLLDSEEAAKHDMRHIVTNAVGGRTPGVSAEVHRIRILPNDVLLLCTDGLTEMVSDKEIAAVLRSYDNPRAASERLVELANAHGGRDNITVIVARFEPPTNIGTTAPLPH